MSKVDGDVEITQVDDNGSAKVTIKVGGVEKTIDFSDGKEGNDVTITGDNTKSTATENLNAEEENTSEAEKSGENTSEVEKSGENTSEVEKSGETEGEGKTQNSAAEGEDEAMRPPLRSAGPEDEEKKDEEKKDEQKPPTLRSRSRTKRPKRLKKPPIR